MRNKVMIRPASLREQVEHALVREFPGRIRPLDERARPVIRSFRNGAFGLSYASFLLYCTGRTAHAPSARYPRGLVYVSAEALFGIGCFVRNAAKHGGIHLVAPAGFAASDAATSVADFLRLRFPRLPVYVRHLGADARRDFCATGAWASLANDGWHLDAPQEDETYNHRGLRLREILDLDRRDNPVLPLRRGRSRQFRCKSRRAFARFTNFLARNGARYELVPYTTTLVPDIRELIERHFFEVSECGWTLLGSSAEDYRNLVGFVPDAGDQDLLFRVGVLKGPSLEKAVSFFAAERLGEDTAGCYSTITRRSVELLPAGWNRVGFSAISQFSIVQFLAMLIRAGVKHVDLGGSETPQLDRFKRQMGALQSPSYWLIYRR